MVTEERGGMAGASQGTCALRKAGSGKESPLFVTAGPRREDGDLSGWDGEKAGRAWAQVEGRKGVRHTAPYLGMVAAQVAQTRHRRYCATVISRGMA